MKEGRVSRPPLLSTRAPALLRSMEIRDRRPDGADEACELVLRPLTKMDADDAAALIRTAFAAQNRPTSPPSSLAYSGTASTFPVSDPLYASFTGGAARTI